ncbi:hypothetical protein PoB_005173900 [Plakobranchus ocellatus]|uniref:Uncharacterized protein n=1 Tax=Plakobranchus ocellatus TaxID=259542 RepID=A0AAV4BYD2_9GAST|nr:hypothetical protein PoB_005173900 [Plakobranchus ocellatus]
MKLCFTWLSNKLLPSRASLQHPPSIPGAIDNQRFRAFQRQQTPPTSAVQRSATFWFLEQPTVAGDMWQLVLTLRFRHKIPKVATVHSTYSPVLGTCPP